MSPSLVSDEQGPTASTLKMEIWPIDKLIPYWRNPRRIGDEAVNAVAESISRFGYQQPIVVDVDGVIVMGHTRYGALRRLGVEEVAVVVADDLTPEQIKQLRTIDNRTSEYSTWDFDKLVDELGTLDAKLVWQFFPEVAGTATEFEPDSGTEDVELGGKNDIFAHELEQPKPTTPLTDTAEFVCPSCFHGWTMKITPKDIEKGRIEVK